MLNNMLPQQAPENNKMLEEVISTVGGLIAAKMAQAETQESSGAPDLYDEEFSEPSDDGS